MLLITINEPDQTQEHVVNNHHDVSGDVSKPLRCNHFQLVYTQSDIIVVQSVKIVDCVIPMVL